MKNIINIKTAICMADKLNSFIITSIVIYLSACAQLCFAQTANRQPLLEDEQLKQHIAKALDNNPMLAALSANVDASREMVSQAGAWKDPTVKLSLMNLPVNSFEFNLEPMTGAWIGVGQVVPWTGKTGLKSDISEHNVEIAYAVKSQRELNLIEMLAHTWFEWGYQLERLKTLDHNIRLIDNLIVIAHTKYETGTSLQQDILRAETKRSKQEDMRIKSLQMISTIQDRFATLIGVGIGENILQPASMRGDFAMLRIDDLPKLLYVQNPNLKIFEFKIESYAKKIDLAKLAVMPDLNYGASYGFRQDSDAGMQRADFFTISIAATVPIYKDKKQSAKVRELKALKRSILHQQRSLRLELEFRLNKLIDQDQRLADQLLLYDDGILPQAEATLAASTAAYSVGKADFEALLMAESILYNMQLEKYERIRDRLKTRASIATLIGGNGLIETDQHTNDNK